LYAHKSLQVTDLHHGVFLQGSDQMLLLEETIFHHSHNASKTLNLGINMEKSCISMNSMNTVIHWEYQQLHHIRWVPCTVNYRQSLFNAGLNNIASLLQRQILLTKHLMNVAQTHTNVVLPTTKIILYSVFVVKNV